VEVVRSLRCCGTPRFCCVRGAGAPVADGCGVIVKHEVVPIPVRTSTRTETTDEEGIINWRVLGWVFKIFGRCATALEFDDGRRQ
jgi:hypothetical protein